MIELSYKLIHRIYPVKTFIIHRFKIAIDNKCVFCDCDPETLDHLFWDCSYVRRFCCELEDFILKETTINVNLKDCHALAIEGLLFSILVRPGCD